MSAPRLAPAPVARRRLAILGTGTVGRALLARLAESPGAGGRLCLVANSRRCLSDPAGLHGDPREGLAVAPTHDGGGDLPGWLQPGDAVVDATASAALAAWHPRWLRRGLHVVTANKLGLGGPLLRQREIAARVAEGARYGDAATVGAGLPLLHSVRALRRGGDRVHAIAGVLSGTLAWLFEGWDGSEPFSARVRAAVAAGFAEPDPRIDLSGEDVRRKLLILARTAGHGLQSPEVRVQSLLDRRLRAATGAAAAIEALPGLDGAMAARLREARATGRVLRYVARFDANGGRAGLELLAPDDPLAGGRGTDNRVAIWSCRYPRQPLVIQGPGAGADVTAAALLDDLLG